MDGFHYSAVSAQASSANVKLWHAIIGAYFWEFFTTLEYEWKVIRGRLPYRWTILIYSFARVATLWVLCSRLSLTSALTSAILSSCYLFQLNKFAVMLAVIVWGIDVVSHIQNTARVRSVRVPGQSFCAPVQTESTILYFIPSIISDIVLLLIMFFGLLILRRRGGGTIGLTYLLWKQGVIWLALATATEVLPLVFIILNMKHHYNNSTPQMLQTPGLVMMIIAATRMHRALVDFASESSDMAHVNVQASSLVISKTKQTDAAPTTLHRIEIAVDTAFEQHPTAQITDDDSSDISTESARPLPNACPSRIAQAQSV
ncbi:hypothetical protein BJV77DRAFT_139589 [Russula vinacea]|nr:hypothetical protein BJV77DRAFT_139589 [Russula vinacea]